MKKGLLFYLLVIGMMAAEGAFAQTSTVVKRTETTITNTDDQSSSSTSADNTRGRKKESIYKRGGTRSVPQKKAPPKNNYRKSAPQHRTSSSNRSSKSKSASTKSTVTTVRYDTISHGAPSPAGQPQPISIKVEVNNRIGGYSDDSVEYIDDTMYAAEPAPIPCAINDFTLTDSFADYCGRGSLTYSVEGANCMSMYIYGVKKRNKPIVVPMDVTMTDGTFTTDPLKKPVLLTLYVQCKNGQTLQRSAPIGVRPPVARYGGSYNELPVVNTFSAQPTNKPCLARTPKCDLDCRWGKRVGRYGPERPWIMTILCLGDSGYKRSFGHYVWSFWVPACITGEVTRRYIVCKKKPGGYGLTPEDGNWYAINPGGIL